MRMVCTVAIIALAFATSPTDAQQTPQTSEPSTALCTFEDGKQISARYISIAADRDEGPPTGKLWAPGGSAVTLFTSTKVTVGSTEIPVGAYSIYFIPGKKNWQLIVSKNVTTATEYDKEQDLLRAPMERGTLNEPLHQLQISFARRSECVSECLKPFLSFERATDRPKWASHPGQERRNGDQCSERNPEPEAEIGGVRGRL